MANDFYLLFGPFLVGLESKRKRKLKFGEQIRATGEGKVSHYNELEIVTAVRWSGASGGRKITDITMGSN